MRVNRFPRVVGVADLDDPLPEAGAVPPQRRVPCVGAIVRHDDRLLLVRRGRPPGLHQWSILGGRVEPGESQVAAVVREVREETALEVSVIGLAGVVERAAPDGSTYVISDFLARLETGSGPASARAGDDALEVGWFPDEELTRIDCVDGLVAALRSWRLLR